MKNIVCLLLSVVAVVDMRAAQGVPSVLVGRHVYQVSNLEKNEFMVSVVGKMAAPEKFTLDVTKLHQYDSALLKDVKIGLERKRGMDYHKWLEDHEMQACCGDTCAFLIPMAIGGFLGGLGSQAMEISDDFTGGACLTGCFGCIPIGVILANKFSDSIEPDQSVIKATIALLEKELASRKEKVD